MFVIRSFPRSGTHMLKSALDSHSKLNCQGELFHPTPHDFSMRRLGAVGHLESFKLGPLDGFVVHGFVPTEGQPYIGIYEDLWQVLRVFHVPMIIVQRQDQIRRAASAKIAQSRRTWRRTPKCPTTEETCTLDVEEFLRALNNVYSCDRLSKQWYPWAHMVQYETLTREWPVEVAKIQQYLGVGVERLVPRIEKQDPRPIADIITNYPRLREQLLKTQRPDIIELVRVADEGVDTAVPTKLKELK